VQVSCGAGEMVQFQEVESKECGLNFKPRVIEPSFGIDRLLYCTLEKSFYVRETDAQRTVLCLPAALAPFKCCVTGLSGD
jgi:glycyl-tRNA synthetase